MIKVAIAGTGGLAQYIAQHLATQTYHQFIMLSRSPNPGLTARGWQVIQVDYGNQANLQYALAGVDTVISTISGEAQIALIDAAAQAHVRRFAPSEFEGKPIQRPANDVLDHGKRNALARLQHYKPYGMDYTVFACGIFYERFAPGGMASRQLGLGSYVSGEGDYVMNVRNMRAQIPNYSPTGQVVHICMTSVQDVARFVIAALDLPQWPTELRMRGERMSVRQVVEVAEALRGGVEFEKALYTEESLRDDMTYAQIAGDAAKMWRLHNLAATAAGRYDFSNPNLNQMVSVVPKRFNEWLYTAWSQA